MTASTTQVACKLLCLFGVIFIASLRIYSFPSAYIPRLIPHKFCALVTFLFLVASPAFALKIPDRPLGYIHDGANMLSPAAYDRLNMTLRSFEDATSNQIFLATFPSLEGQSLEDFSIRLAETWKPGQKGRDNGVIFLIFRDDRKMRIEVGYGLEGALPDALAGEIIVNEVAPFFKAGDYEKGIHTGVKAIMDAVKGEYEGRPQETEPVREDSLGYLIQSVIILLGILFASDLFRYGRYAYGRRLYKDRHSFGGWMFRFSMALIVLNLVYRILSHMLLETSGGYHGNRRGYGRGPYSGGDTGSFGGGFSGGGFSGAGGGSFGGGGASGGW